MIPAEIVALCSIRRSRMASAVVEKGEWCDPIAEAIGAVVAGAGVPIHALAPADGRVPQPREAGNDLARQSLSARESRVLTHIARGLTPTVARVTV